MRKVSFKSLLAVMAAATMCLQFTSCGDDDPEVYVNTPSVNFGESGGSQTVQVTSNSDWTVNGAPGWLTVAPMQGSDNGYFTITASANTDNSSRNCVLYVTAGKVSTTVSVNQSGHVKPTKITITNNSTYSLYRFRVVFLNSRLELLTDRDCGTFDPGATVTVDIPTAATEFYMATYLNNRWFFSPDYDVTYTDLRLTTGEINNWSSSSSAYRDPKDSSAN